MLEASFGCPFNALGILFSYKEEKNHKGLLKIYIYIFPIKSSDIAQNLWNISAWPHSSLYTGEAGKGMLRGVLSEARTSWEADPSLFWGSKQEMLSWPHKTRKWSSRCKLLFFFLFLAFFFNIINL